MVFALIENFVLFSALFAVLAYAGGVFLRFAISRDWIRIAPFSLSRIYAGLIVIPPVLSSWFVLAALLPETWLGTELFRKEHFAPVHELHLLSDLTHSLEPFLSFATVLFLLIISFFVVWKSFRGYLRIGGIIRFLEVEEIRPQPEKIALVENIADRYGMEVGLVMSPQTMTFVWGYWKSKIVLSSGLLNELSLVELKGVMEHEAAHHTRRDNLLKLVSSAASYLSLAFPLTRRLLSWQAEQIELVCDEIAAINTRKPLEIASALVKVRRAFPCRTANHAFVSGFMTEKTPGIELRVKRLLDLADSLPSNKVHTKLKRNPLADAVSIAVCFVSSLSVVVFFAPLVVHETAETLIRIIK